MIAGLHFLALPVIALRALALTLANSSPTQLSSYATENTTDIGPSSLFTTLTNPPNIVLTNSGPTVASTFLPGLTSSASPPGTWSSNSSTADSVISIPSSTLPSILSSSALFTPSPIPITVFITQIVTKFETTTIDAVSPSSPTVTVITTATATATATTTLAPTASWGNRTRWASPQRMADLSTFNVTYFPSGQRNLDIVAQIPVQAIAPSAKFIQPSLLESPDTTAPYTILQLVYPAHSVNPGSKPEGGADFYATPLNLSGARNVTLKYSVFFPAGFNWVKGGKLPGLFGGHTGCSGGASARNCFSTRLMWRPQGAGELYLYAPKDKQSEALCADAASVCDVTYGFSIGRGSFNFTAGDWTHLSQNVILNTPGQNDGVFMLSVDGWTIINRTDMFYRDDAPQPVEFLGLFFSTFFGGHGKEYATPNQQYTWFRDFAITRHD